MRGGRDQGGYGGCGVRGLGRRFARLGVGVGGGDGGMGDDGKYATILS